MRFLTNVIQLCCLSIVSITSIADSESWGLLKKFSFPINCIEVDAKNRLFVGTDSFLFRTFDKGSHWDSIPGRIPNLITKDSTYLFGIFVGVFKSTNAGNSWIALPRISNLETAFLNQLAIHPNGDLFGRIESGMAVRGLYRSQDNGNSWSQIVCPVIYPQNLIITRNGDIFVDGFRSRDLGNTWKATIPATMIGIQSIAVIDSGIILASDSSHIYQSIDDGATWSSVYSGNFYYSIYRYNFLAVDSKKTCFAATSNGIIRSPDSGRTWISVNNGLVDKNMQSISIDKNDVLYASTVLGKIYSIQSAKTATQFKSTDKAERPISLRTNLLSPINQNSIVRYDLATACHVTLTIYDMLGRKAGILINEFQSEGPHSVVLNRTLTGRQYFVRLELPDKRVVNGRMIYSK